jgi:hypothetical protein
MIKHVVMWKMREEAEGNTKAANITLMKEKLLALKETIPQINSLEVGININPADAAYDITLISTHKNESELKEYIANPAHQDVLGFILKVIADRKVVDYIC